MFANLVVVVVAVVLVLVLVESRFKVGLAKVTIDR